MPPSRKVSAHIALLKQPENEMGTSKNIRPWYDVGAARPDCSILGL
jgi:hypothetical protein